MKNVNIAVLMLVMGISFTYVSCALFFAKGNGNLKTAERAVSSFEKISVRDNAEVRYYHSDEYRAVVTVDSNLDKYVEVYTRGNVLTIGNKRRIHHLLFTKYLVEVYGPTLTGVSLSGSGSFTGNDTIITSAFETNLSGAGNITGSIECNDFSANISGVGKINVAGNGNNSKINISGLGNFNGNNFAINKAAVFISGSGDADILVTDNLDANIAGAGSINVAGNGNNLNVNISGLGNFRGNNFTTNNATVGISGSGNVDINVTDNLNATISGLGSINYQGDPKINSRVSGLGKINKL